MVMLVSLNPLNIMCTSCGRHIGASITHLEKRTHSQNATLHSAQCDIDLKDYREKDQALHHTIATGHALV